MGRYETAHRAPQSAVTALPVEAFLDAPNEVTSPDFGLFRDTLNKHFYPARIEALDAPLKPQKPRIAAVHLSLTTIGYVRPGTTASVDPGDLSAYHVNVVLNGSVASRCGDQEAVATPSVATVFSPDRHTSLPRWDAAAAQLSIKFARTRVEEELAALLGRSVVKPIDFQLAFLVDRGAGRRWMAVLAALLQSVDAVSEQPPQRHVELLERSLISSLLMSQPHSYSEDLVVRSDPAAGSKGMLNRVVDEIMRSPDRGYTIADLARLSGMSARSLQYAFQDCYGISPMRFLRQVRLDRAHDDLAQGTSTVTEVASYWGFTNLGRFSQAYKVRFGEFPNATLEGYKRREVRHLRDLALPV